MPSYDKVVLFEGARWNPIMTYKNPSRVAQDITGFVFIMNFLDKRGGSIIKTIAPAIYDAATGRFRPSLTEAEITGFRTDNTIPAWMELFVVVSPGTDPLKWMDLPVDYRQGGR